MEMTLDKWVEDTKHWRHRDHEIAFHEAGTGSALVLIHGFPTCSWDWHRVWPGLALGYRLVAADMIGFGQSAKPRAHAYSIFDQADLYEGLLASLGVERVHILAHDYGDTVAQEMLARFTERRGARAPGAVIESVCFLNGGLFPETQQPLLIQRLLASPVGGLAGRLVPRFRRRHGATLPRAGARSRRRRATPHRPLPATRGSGGRARELRAVSVLS